MADPVTSALTGASPECELAVELTDQRSSMFFFFFYVIFSIMCSCSSEDVSDNAVPAEPEHGRAPPCAMAAPVTSRGRTPPLHHIH